MDRWTELEGFEPQARARSNTWPLPRPENHTDDDTKEEDSETKPQLDDVPGAQVPAQGPKKNPSRRNAWGSLSYADLIAQAIGSAPEKRLTLSQIYEWMVQNIPYFKDKGESNSSAGWKNSIRHNLSLHNRFMRVQNIGHGKSSWWVINPDAKPGRSTRRRTASMETKKFEKKRGRVRKKVETLRNGLLPLDATSSPGSSVSEGLDVFPDSPLHSVAGFQLSADIRPRASSNASSCSRLSPIPASESEWSSPVLYPGSYTSEQLADSLAEGMKLHHETLLQGRFNSEAPDNTRPGHAASPCGISICPLHRVQGCGCALTHFQRENFSSSYFHPQNESSSDSLTGYDRPRTTPSTMMGQLMGALNSSATLDDLNLGIDTFHGGFDCNVDEVIRHELSMDGSLDFNFSHNQMSLVGRQTESSSAQPPGSYSTTLSVTGPSWVL